jgi:hypothetical protein
MAKNKSVIKDFFSLKRMHVIHLLWCYAIIIISEQKTIKTQRKKMSKENEGKTLDERIDRIYKMAKEHYGEVRFVGIKRHTKIGWVAKIQFDSFDSLVAEGKDAIDALKNLRKRLKKIINRYHMV